MKPSVLSVPLTLAVLVVLTATTVFASTPRPLPANFPPLQPAPPVPPAPPRPFEPPVHVFNRSVIENLAISSTVKRDLLAHLRFGDLGVASLPDSASAIDVPGANGRHGRQFRVAALTTVTPAAQAVNDPNEDVEPAVITNRFSGIDRTTTAYTKFPNPNTFVPSTYWSSTTDYVNFIGGQLPLPAGTNRSSDPMLSENPYVSLGAFPKRTYCSGTSYTIDANGILQNSALTVWYTDNPGTNPWTTSVVDTDNNPFLIDKPAVWVSWHTGTLGYTYVAAVRANVNTGFNTIQVYRKTTTDTWTRVITQFSGTAITSPIITVDSSNGDVYLLWVNWQNNTINVARSTDMGNTFGAAVSYAAGALNNGNRSVCDINGANCVRAASVIMARPNAADGSIGVVWHRREAGSTNTDVYFNSFVLASQTWRTERRLNDFTSRDQWNPALDPASDGTYFTIWYDKRGDPNDQRYIVYGAKITASGDPVDPSNTLVFSNIRASDPSRYTPDPNSGNIRYLGEYHDIWEWFGTWYGATVYIPDPATGGSGQGDIYIPRITP